MKLKVKYHDEKMPKLKKIQEGNWIDLSVVENRTVVVREGKEFPAKWELNEKGEKVLRYKKGDFLKLSTGLTIATPDGYEVYVAPRSSTFQKYGLILVNSIGIGDTSFRGNKDVYMMPMFALMDGEVCLYDRVGQFRIQESMSDLTIEEVEDTGYSNRGGFGTTGSGRL